VCDESRARADRARLPPLDATDAREMLSGIRGTRLLDGFRGAPACDREALADVLLRVGRLAMDLPEIVELDLNPLMALSQGHGACVVDARIRVRGTAPTARATTP
jgi:acyl-CoA synthetase (NDP forming)